MNTFLRPSWRIDKKNEDMIIKVCGMRDAANIRDVAELEIDMMGFDFRPSSPRYVQMISSRAGIIPDYSRERLTRSGRWLTGEPAEWTVARTGVFADDMPQNIVTRVYNYSLDYVQLDGSESRVMIENLLRTLRPDIRPTIKIIKTLPIAAAEDIERYKAYEGAVDLFLFKASDAIENATERSFDWHLLQAYDGHTPFLVGGGIGAEDAEQILKFDHPQFVGIDLNSRFETEPGIKDTAMLQTFVQRIKTDRTNGCNNCHEAPQRLRVTAADAALPWYAVRLFTHRPQMVYDYLEEHALTYFVPMEYVEFEDQHHRLCHRLRPVVHNLFFLQKTLRSAHMQRILSEAPFKLSVIRKEKGGTDYYEIPARQMAEFQTMCNPDIAMRKFLTEAQARLKSGTPVYVKYGPLKGLSGRLVRYNKRYFLLKEIPGMGVMLKVARWCCEPVCNIKNN